ncbi:MAG: F0F1 ATP synthase subunit gamma [Burkholderiaceae bacterium]
MSDALAALKQQIGSATDLQSIVRTMRALAASSIHQYEQAVLALAEYQQAVNLGLGACFNRSAPDAPSPPVRRSSGSIAAIVFGSDQGLVGQFNEVIVAHAVQALARIDGAHVVWAVGERGATRLRDAGIAFVEVYPVPTSVEGIAPLIEQIQFDIGTHPAQIAAPHAHLFYNRPLSRILYEPVQRRLLPLDETWRAQCRNTVWPTNRRPEVMGQGSQALRALIREHLYITVYRACAESLASENASRLAAMERADKNIEEMLATLQRRLHGQRQRAIDDELFDVVAGYEALSGVRSASAAGPASPAPIVKACPVAACGPAVGSARRSGAAPLR